MSDPRNHLSVDVGRGILPRQMMRRRGQVVDLRQTDRKELPARVTISFIAPLGLDSSRERPQKVPTEQEGPIVVAVVVVVIVLLLVDRPLSSSTILFLFRYSRRRGYVGKRGQKTVDRGDRASYSEDFLADVFPAGRPQ